ncbi:hypothetical protein Tco_1113193 [Tanacetum coccineum]|uniref:Uncharacterized protein n=1 Tax=Tanacetum coccineum TaxID=301880 RepID=A0ABQ5IT05_9ASTR
MLGAARVQILENNLDDLHSSREENGTSETIDTQDLPGSFLLADIDLIILGVSLSRAVGFLKGTSVGVVSLVKGHTFPTIVKVRLVGCDPLALVDGFTPVEDNIGLLKTSIIEIQKVIHTVKIDKVKQIVDVESSGKSADEIDKETVSFEFIMAQPQRQADVHQDEFCPPNKRYALMDANKKMDLDNPFNWIHLGQFWHTLKEDGLKYRLSFMLVRKELTLTVDDFRTIFQLPQVTNNNHEHFIATPKFLKMVPFYIKDLGFTLELRSPSNFKITGLVQPWKTLCKMFSSCLTTRVTSFDQPPLQIMQMLYCFVNNIHVDYADLLWEGLHYSLEHPSTLIPYPRFTKLIVSHYMIAFPEISRRDSDKYYNLEDDMIVKNIFNLGKHKDGVGMKILMFGVDVPTSQLQPIESTQGTHRTTSASRSPNPDVDEGESSALRKSAVIRLHIPQRRSTRLTPPTPIPTTAEADDILLQDTIQLSLVEQKSHNELEAKKNVQVVEEHLIAEEIEKLVEGTENVEIVEVNSSTLRQNDTQNDPDTRLEPRSNKESPEVEITAEVQPVNINKEEEESAEDDYELKRREKGRM